MDSRPHCWVNQRGWAMTDITGIVSGVADRAKSKVEQVAVQAHGLAQQILAAHQSVVAAERTGHSRSLELGIKAGELLLLVKDVVVRGGLPWGKWRSENLPVSQTILSAYMRAAQNKDRLLHPTGQLATRLGKLAADGQLSMRKAIAALADKKTRGAPKAKRTERR